MSICQMWKDSSLKMSRLLRKNPAFFGGPAEAESLLQLGSNINALVSVTLNSVSTC